MISLLKKIRSLHVLIALVVILVATVIKFSPWQNAGQSGKLIAWDVTSYYGYLPAKFIHDDLSLNFVAKDSAYYHEQQMFWPETAPNGGKVIKTTMGLSILYSPFFAIANTTDDDTSINRGFSETYEFWLVISSIFYTIIGIVLLRAFLLKHFDDEIVSFTLIALYLGTNLFYYITIEPLMPHAYNFFLISTFLFLTHRWHANPSWLSSALLGIVFGLIFLIRPVNGIVALFFIFYDVTSLNEIKERLSLFKMHLGKLVTGSLIVLIVLLPQLLYWKSITGEILFNSYTGERFYFGNPHLIDGLFSYRKGWLLYTPIMIFSLVGLFISKRFRLSTLIVILPSLYLMFSWWNWWFGGGFGCRPIIDFYPILGIGLASFIHMMVKTPVLKYSFSILFPVLLAFNLFQTLQKKSDAIHWDSMTKEAYWHNFLHRYPLPGLEEKFQAPDNDAALKGEDEY